MTRSLLPLIISALLTTTADASGYADHPQAKALIDRLVSEHNYDRGQLEAWLSKAEKQERVLEAMSRPAEKVKRWDEYRPIFVQESRIEQGVEFLRENRARLQRAEEAFGIPAEIIVAIIGVETRYGKYKGRDRVMDAVATLAFDYPPRSKFFTSELEQFFLLCREENLDPLEIKGSYAGAMGMPQFISSSYRHYAVDFNDNGQRNLFAELDDIIGSVANYFRRHGWKTGEHVALMAEMPAGSRAVVEPTRLKADRSFEELVKAGVRPAGQLPGDQPAGLLEFELENGHEYWIGLHNFFVITRYNRSPMYAMAVFQLSQAIRERAQAG